MDILHLVDRLEELFNNSNHPLSRNVGGWKRVYGYRPDENFHPDEVTKAQQIIVQRISFRLAQNSQSPIQIACEKGANGRAPIFTQLEQRR